MANSAHNRHHKHRLFGEYIFLGIFSSLLIFVAAKELLGWRLDLVRFLAADMAVGIVVIGLGTFLISRRSAKNELHNAQYDIYVYLQNKSIIPVNQTFEEQKDIKSIKKKIFSYFSGLIDKLSMVNKRCTELEDTLAKFTDVKSGSLKDISEIKGEIKAVTILFTDIRGFGALCEAMNSEEIIRFLNVYFRDITTIIHKNNGIVSKLVGDAIMAVFEIKKIEHELPPELRAINAAMEIQQIFGNVLQRAKINILRPIQIGLGIGITTGQAVVGTIGSEERMEYAIIGDIVNFAGTLSTMAGMGVTLLGADTYEKISGKIDAIESEPVSIKGNTGLHKVYILKGIRLIER